ncbi:MAG: GNAT family N-acetyltransferase [bacterium]
MSLALLASAPENTIKGTQITNSTKKWLDLAALLQQEDVLLKQRNTAQKLQTLYNAGLAIIEEMDGTIIALSALWPIRRNIFELGSVWVHPDMRQQNLGSKVFNACITHIEHTRAFIFLITHDPKVIHLVQKAKWEKATLQTWNTVVPKTVDKGLHERLVKHQKRCKSRIPPEECCLFFTHVL